MRGRVPDRATWLRRLEEHRRDLEQELADVSDLIRHLGDGEAGTAGTATATSA
jgi:hypothetical protein